MTDVSKRPVSRAVAEAIREARMKKRMSQSELAIRSGLSVAVITEIESKARPATIPELQRLRRGLSKDGTKFFSKAFWRIARNDPELRAMAVDALSTAIADIKIRLAVDEAGESSTSTLQ